MDDGQRSVYFTDPALAVIQSNAQYTSTITYAVDANTLLTMGSETYSWQNATYKLCLEADASCCIVSLSTLLEQPSIFTSAADNRINFGEMPLNQKFKQTQWLAISQRGCRLSMSGYLLISMKCGSMATLPLHLKLHRMSLASLKT